ncbi:MAG TPA: ABC transporter permease subunit [Candidatus Limnocylindrales bacterium]|nr:ABC transporter permease subunit [Candidatus Limnocylindrales bacterium]
MSGAVPALVVSCVRSIRRAVVWWAVSIAVLVALTVAFWPAFRGASGITQAIETLPTAVIDAFGLDSLGTPAGFLRGNLYELFVPLLFSVAAVALVKGQTANDESAGRLELFLAQPVSRRTLFAARSVACLAGLAVIVVATIAIQLVSDAVIGLEIDTGAIFATATLCGLLAAFHASIAFCIACLRPKPSAVLAGGIGVSLAGYVVSALFPISTALKPWRVLSPWDWALGGNPLEQASEPWRFIALGVPAVLLVLIGLWGVTRRDVAAA